MESAAYNKILDLLIELRDTQDHFKPYSASDIKGLIKRNEEAKNVPRVLLDLYRLGDMIGVLRESMNAARANKANPPQEDS